MIQCPGGSNMTELLEIGVQRFDENNNMCPNVMHDTYNGIKLDLEPGCSWKWDPRTTKDPEKK